MKHWMKLSDWSCCIESVCRSCCLWKFENQNKMGVGGFSLWYCRKRSNEISFHLNHRILWFNQKSPINLLAMHFNILLAVLLVIVHFTNAITYSGSVDQEVFNPVHHYHGRPLRQQRETRNDEEKGYCAPYNGKICKKFISTYIWYSREDPSGGWKNEQITTALWEELIGDLSGLCRTAAEVIALMHFVLINSKI